MAQEVLRGLGKEGELEGGWRPGDSRAELEPETWVLGHCIETACPPRK